ncbi:G-type lectin S-receptor-like serine/threonine-protein kinase At1g61390 [Linum perenne]
MNRAGFALFFFLTNFLLCSSSSSLPLPLNQTLTSQNEVFEVGFFAPDRNRSRNLYLGVRFKHTSPQTIVWVGNREAPVAEESARLLVNGDGNLELQDGRRRRIWATRTSLPLSRCGFMWRVSVASEGIADAEILHVELLHRRRRRRIHNVLFLFRLFFTFLVVIAGHGRRNGGESFRSGLGSEAPRRWSGIFGSARFFGLFSVFDRKPAETENW